MEEEIWGSWGEVGEGDEGESDVQRRGESEESGKGVGVLVGRKEVRGVLSCGERVSGISQLTSL